MRPKIHSAGRSLGMGRGERESASRWPLLSAFIVALISVMAIGSCTKRGTSPNSLFEDAHSIVSYPDRPARPNARLNFREDLSICHEGWWPNKILMDKGGNILVSVYRENVIYIFDHFGKELSNMQFAKGEGPSDFSAMEPELSNTGNLHIYDQVQQKLALISLKDGHYISGLKFSEMRWVFTLGKNEDSFFWVLKPGPASSDSRVLVLSQFNESGKLIREYDSYQFASGGENRGKKRIYRLFSPYGIYKVDHRGYLYVAISDSYEIHVYSPDGLPLRRMIMKREPRKPIQRDLDMILPYYSDFPKDETDLEAPEQMPFIADLFILPDSSLLVLTFEIPGDPSSISADWYDPDGRFLNRVQIPEYYQWFKPFGPGGSHAVFYGDYFYSIKEKEGDKKEDIFLLKRYDWNHIQRP